MTLLRLVERFMRRHGMAPTRLGREMVNDPRFVSDLRQGRVPRAETEARVRHWIAAHDIRTRHRSYAWRR